MDYDNYVKNMAQKYKIAIAIAVIKEKPDNLTIEQYINDLRNKINITNKSDDLDLTLGSEDFNFNDNDEMNGFNDKLLELNDNISNRSITILDNFDVNMTTVEELHIESNRLNETPHTNNSQDLHSIDSEPLKDLATNKNDARSKALNILRNIRKESVNKIQEPHTDKIIYIDINDRVNNNSVSSKQLDDFKQANTENQNKTGLDSELTDATDNLKTQKNNVAKDFADINNDNETESLQTFKVNDNLAAKVYNNISKNPNTRKYHKAIENIGIEEMDCINGNIIKNARKELTKSLEHKEVEELDITEKVRQYLAKQTQDILEKAKMDKNHYITNTQVIETQTIGVIDDSFEKTVNINTKINDISNQINLKKNPLPQIDSQATILYTYQGASQNCTHISQSQTDNIEIANNFIFGRKDDVYNYEMSKRTDSMYNNWDCIGTTGATNNADTSFQREYCEEIDNNTPTNNILKDKEHSKAESSNYNDVDMFQMGYITEKSDNTIVTNKNPLYNSIQDETNTEYSRNVSQELNKVNTRTDIEMNANQTQIAYVIDKNGNAYKILNGNFQNNNTITLAKETNIQKVFGDTNYSQIVEDTQEKQIELDNIDMNSTDEEILPTQKEIVPFKVIEELNKVKMFLNRKVERNSEGYLTDSGYNSDSQSRSSFKSALQNSNGWVNQSAFCLFNYIIECPLNEATSDLNIQISQVLGKLIDKLHDIENYPSFLEEILEYINKLIQNIYTIDNSILTNDEYIQRILLLNKSIHIIKYSVEKITIKLEDLHQKLTTHFTFELENILELENVCHLFHLLETLIKRYLKCRNNSNEMATQSQEEKLFKKSSITDIWKKKWNPDYKKVEKSQGLFEKKCVMNKCSDLLNKIVVNCMEGYSLVAFAALQCFNLLQS